MPKPSDGAKKLIGDFSPKLVELTGRVLLDDIWERKELSNAIAALSPSRPWVALNRPDHCGFISGKPWRMESRRKS